MACNVLCKSREIMTKLEIKELGTVDYEETHRAMLQLIASKPCNHTIWVLEHDPVFTIGISEKSIQYKHALKNGLIPVITIAGINIGTLVAFSIITETVFQWPGMGFLFIQAVKFVDIPIMSAYLVFIAFIFVMINFIVDILYYFIDPRIRVKSEKANG